MPKVSRLRYHKPPRRWLEATNQMWKLSIALVGFGLSLMCFLGGGVTLFFGTTWFGPLLFMGTCAGGLTFGWLLTTLRCPTCRDRLVWTMISSRSHLSWLVELTQLETCPSCQSPLMRRASSRWRAIY